MNEGVRPPLASAHSESLRKMVAAALVLNCWPTIALQSAIKDDLGVGFTDGNVIGPCERTRSYKISSCRFKCAMNS